MADATATTETSGYTVNVEDLGSARKRLTITVPAEIIQEKVEESMGTLVMQTVLPGFRKGRAPRALIERRFGGALRDETRNQVIADGYAKALEEHDIKPLGEPVPLEKLEDLQMEVGKPLTFSVEVEVVPQFDLPSFDDLEIKKPVIEVTDEHVAAELKRQCTQLGEIQPIDHHFQEGDRILGPGTATKHGDEEPFFRHDNVDIIVPSDEHEGRGHVLGLLIEGLAGMIKGKRVGDKLVIKAVGPESHELEDIRGKELTIEVTIREGQRIIPATPQAVVDQYGLGSEQILREQLRLALEQRRDEEQRSAMREQVYSFLAGSVDFDLPERLSNVQAGRLLERQRLELLYRGGLSVDEVETRLAEMRSETEAQSRARLKLSFLLHRLAEQFGVHVTDQEINGRIAAIASQRGMRPEKLRADLIQSGGIGSIAMQLREHKAADRVIDQVRVLEIPAEEWNREFMEQQKAARESRSKSGAKTGAAAAPATTKKKTAKKTAAGSDADKPTTKKKTSKKKK